MELKIARRYAQALFETARDQDSLASVGREIEELSSVARENPQVRTFLSNPLVPAEKHWGFMEKLLEQAGSSELVQKFVRLLVDRGRIVLLPAIDHQFQTFADEHQGVVSAEIETARDFDEATHERLVDALSRYTGKTVRLSVQVNPELIAGFRVQLGSLLIDGTLEKQLDKLNRTILKG